MLFVAKTQQEKSTFVRKTRVKNVDEFFVWKLLRQLFSSYMYVEKAAKMKFLQKFVRKMLMKLTPENLN